MRNTSIRRAFAAGASVAVAAAGLAALAPAAQAATVNLEFNCSASILQDQKFQLEADFSAPKYLLPGQAADISFSGNVVVPNGTRAAAYVILDGRALEGSATVAGTFAGEDVTMVATLPRTEIPSTTGPMSVPASGAASFETPGLGAHDLTVSGFTAPLTMTKSDGSTDTVEVTCTATAPATVIATVNVVEEIPEEVTVQATKTTAKVKVTKKKAKATVKVANADKSAAKGKVKLTLKKGKKVVAKKTVKLNKKGKKAVTFKKLKKGKYSLLAQYQGNATSKKSKKKVTFRVR